MEEMLLKVHSRWAEGILSLCGPPTISGVDLGKWCDARKVIPPDEDAPFVLNYAESLNPNEQDLEVVIPSRRLPQNLKKSVMVQTDATYKMIW
jgi:hypothetical protein